jgi:hypothetical protein
VITKLDIKSASLTFICSYNEELTAEGFRAFGRTLQAASTALGSSVRLPQHIVTTIDPCQCASFTMEEGRLAKVLNMTVNKIDKSVWLKSTGERQIPSYAENRSEHVHIM